MSKRATPAAIAEYRDKLLTNPVTFGHRLAQVREDLRARSEVLFIDRDLTASDKAIDEEAREAEFERIDEQILRVGARIDDLDAQIKAHNEAHPDAELAAKIAAVGGGPQHTPMVMSRQQRRAIQRQAAKAATKDVNAGGSAKPEAQAEPEPTAEETPEAE